jgi:dTMP kinase
VAEERDPAIEPQHLPVTEEADAKTRAVPRRPESVIPPESLADGGLTIETLERAASGGYRRLLSMRGFRNLWISQTISGIGDWLVIGLLIPLVTQLSNGSSFAVAGIMIAKILPSLLLSSVIGVVVDRYDRRRLMMAMDILSAVLCMGLMFTSQLFLIYLIVFLMESASLLFVPAKNSIIPQLVEEKDLAAANGLSYTTTQASMLIGLTMSGAIVAVYMRSVQFLMNLNVPFVSDIVKGAPFLVGPRAGVFLDSLSFLVSASLIATIVVTGDKREHRPFDIRLFGRDVIEAFTVLGEVPELRSLLISAGLAILGGGAIVSVGLVYVQQNLVVGAVPFLDKVPMIQRLVTQPSQTFIMVFLALGMVGGALLVPQLAKRFKLVNLFVAGVIGFGLAMLAFSSVGNYWVAAGFGVIAGAMLAQISVAGYTYVAEAVADEKRGRVFTALESVIRVALLLSMVVIAPIGDIVGTYVRAFVEANHIVPATVVLTGSRLTLWFASAIVIGAAVYAFTSLKAPDRAKKGDGLVAEGGGDA